MNEEVTVSQEDLRELLAEALRGAQSTVPYPYRVEDVAEVLAKTLADDTVVLHCVCPHYDDEPFEHSDGCPVGGGMTWEQVQEARHSLGRQLRTAKAEAADEERRLVSERDTLKDALRNLVDLKDGPRDEHYEVAKPMAWDMARMLVGSERKVTEDTVGTNFRQTVERLISESKANPFMVDLPGITPLFSTPEPDEITLIVGPTGRVSQVIIHSTNHLSCDTVERLAQEIAGEVDSTVLVLAPDMRVREVVVTRLPEDAPQVIVEDAEEVSE